MKLRATGKLLGLNQAYFDTRRNGYPGEPLGTDCFIYIKNFGKKTKKVIKASNYALHNVLLWAKSQDPETDASTLMLAYGKKLEKDYGT